MKRFLICIFAALFRVEQGMESDEEDQCDSGTQINMPYQRRTMYPQLYPETADCPTRARALTVILGQRKCSKRLVNWHKLRGTWCEKGEDGKADPNGIGQANCVMQFKRAGSGLTDGELLVFCRSYMKLKCDKVLM